MRTYVSDIEEIMKRRGFLEKTLSFFGFIKYCPEGLKKRYKEALEFAHLTLTPEEVFSSAIILPTLLLFVGFLVFIIFGFSTSAFFMLIVFSVLLFYYIYNYPFIQANAFKMKATSEMMLAIIYIGMSMKLVPNLERAIHFAATNLRGPLAKDLGKVLWDVYTGKHSSLQKSLDDFIEKWKHENKEFTEAMTIIKNVSFQNPAQISVAIDEAISVMMDESKSYMEREIMNMKSPLTVLNAFGVLLPILGMMFIPIASIFIPEAFNLPLLILTYNISLPLFLFWYSSSYLKRRPYTFHQPEFPEERFKKFDLIAVIVATVLFLIFSIITIPGMIHGEEKLLPSIIFIFGLGVSIASLFFLKSFFKLDFRNKIVEMEKEIGEFVFMLGMALTYGKPVEETIYKIKERIKSLRMKELMDKLIYNIKVLGMPLRSALLDAKSGVITSFPSYIIGAVFRVIAEISTRGTVYLSQALVSISRYLKGMRRIEDLISEELSEITSSMRLQAWLLAPLTSAIVVALLGIMMRMLLVIQGLYERVTSSVSSVAGATGVGVLSQMFNFQKLVGAWVLQLSLGIYTIEVIIILSYFISKIEHGEEEVVRDFEIAKTLFIGILIYTGITIFTYHWLSSIVMMVV